ncbi:hypothetical protein GGX14DRAFT_625057 [Mycena pura]|uniref:DUF6535 domain-containing protein n=1 Tax=Mycena pura TaxID=153505 RepID=A0AAD6VG02_9AGAR|nr:hypothetical protein GGX14DRAFT_625057 [Mycena pura]
MSHEVLPPLPSTPIEHTSINEEHGSHSLSSDNDQYEIAESLRCHGTHDMLNRLINLRIQKAVEALKPPVTVTDKKSAFWTSYMKLADEHDKEFKEKYSTDLDTSLIFAGLFSAIASAFIILIQPQLALDPPIKIVVAQSILYISLFTTLLAALLAVLGKQWLMYYQAAGSRGTTEQRGLERQRKLDGLNKWKFDAVLQMFPLLLQLGLLLFSTALSVYLWAISVPIAIIVLSFTVLGFVAYLFLLGSAIFSPDSPFQNPLAPLLKHTISLALHILQPLSMVRDWCSKLTQNIQQSMLRFGKSHVQLLPSFTAHSSLESPNTPLQEDFPETDFVELSAEVPAVLWVLETSTDPMMISTAAEMAIDLQWPLNLDLTLSMNRLDETFIHWLNSEQKIQEGIVHPATYCGMAYCSLRLFAQASGHDPHRIGWWSREQGHPPDLQHVIGLYRDWPDVFNASATSRLTKWALNIIPSLERKRRFGGSLQDSLEYFLDQFTLENMQTLDEEDVCNFLCCLNTFVSPCNPKLMMQKSKKAFKVVLMTQLFTNFQTAKIDPALVASLLKTTSDLLNMTGSERQYGLTTRQVKNLIMQISQFCSALPQQDGWFDLVVSAAMFARNQNIGFFDYSGEQFDEEPHNVQWIYLTLEHVQTVWATLDLENWDTRTTTAVDGLLALLAWHPLSLSDTPSEECLKIITRALSTDGSSACSAFFILTHAHGWFLDPQLQPVLQSSTVWTHIGSVVSDNIYDKLFSSGYFELWVHLATISEWKLILFHKLPAWITVFSQVIFWNEELLTKFSTIIRTVWVVDVNDWHQSLDKYEQVWALSITALTKAWEAFKFDSSAVCDFVRLSRGTVVVTLKGQYYLVPTRWKDISSDLRYNLLREIGKVLIQAAQSVMQTMSDNSQQVQGNLIVEGNEDALTRAADLLRALGQVIITKFEPGSEVQLGGMAKKYKDWDDLRILFETEIASIESSLVGGVISIEVYCNALVLRARRHLLLGSVASRVSQPSAASAAGLEDACKASAQLCVILKCKKQGGITFYDLRSMSPVRAKAEVTLLMRAVWGRDEPGHSTDQGPVTRDLLGIWSRQGDISGGGARERPPGCELAGTGMEVRAWK